MASVATGEELRIGRVVSLATGAFGRHFLTYLGLLVVLLGIPLALVVAIVGASAYGGVGFTWALIPVWLVMIAGGALLQAALVRATVLDLDGQPVSFGSVLPVGLAILLPLVGLSLVTTFGVMLGMILLLVPGLILAMMWSVALPAMVQERLGVGESLSRSRQLTSGVRWRIFGLYVAFTLGWIVLSTVLGFVMGALLGAGMGGAIANIVSSAIFPMMIGIIGAALYVELRRTREGASVEQLAEVFA